jgi:hypothetical protein
MSTAWAIAQVTATLVNLIDKATDALGSVDVIAKPPNVAAENARDYVNVFLYLTRENAAGRNLDLPARDASGARNSAYPLTLNLHYLISAYSKTIFQQEVLLGHAMQALHEHPVLSPAAIRQALLSAGATELSESGAPDQLEQIKITPHSLSADELSKLWGAFQAPFRTSATYSVSVVVIESPEPRRSALPVRELGASGVASPSPALPLLSALTPPNRQNAIRVGETLTLRGTHLGAGPVRVRFHHRLRSLPIELQATAGSSGAAGQSRIEVALTATAPWAVGIYSVQVALSDPRGGHPRITNALPMTLAPTLSGLPTPTITRTEDETLIDGLGSTPAPLDGQDCSLLLDDIELLRSSADQTLRFRDRAGRIRPGTTYRARLRVDGVDSLLLRYDAEQGRLVFDETQRIEVPAA